MRPKNTLLFIDEIQVSTQPILALRYFKEKCQILETLSWVAKKSGKLFFEFDEKGNTRTCSDCQYQQGEGIPPSIRQWQCPCCKTQHLRDENAAKNGLRKVLIA